MGRNGDTSLNAYTVLGILGILEVSAAMLTVLVSAFAVGLLGAQFAIAGGLIVGLLFFGAGLRTFDMSFDSMESVGGFMISAGLVLLGLQLFFSAFGMDWLNFLPSWLIGGIIGLGVVLVNWHHIESIKG